MCVVAKVPFSCYPIKKQTGSSVGQQPEVIGFMLQSMALFWPLLKIQVAEGTLSSSPYSCKFPAWSFENNNVTSAKIQGWWKCPQRSLSFALLCAVSSVQGLIQRKTLLLMSPSELESQFWKKLKCILCSAMFNCITEFFSRKPWYKHKGCKKKFREMFQLAILFFPQSTSRPKGNPCV